MKRPLKQYAVALYDAVKTPGAKISDVVSNFTKLLQNDGVIAKTDAIMALFTKYWNEQNKEIDGEVMTAHPITSAQKKHIGEAIATMTQKTTCTLHETVREELLGGTIIRFDDTVIDGSVRRQLAEMKRSLTQ